ncbi:MAG: hypothetical protein ICV62_14520, partial [Cyanobacteria bacterium Co-bin13]|nr:hypothetical protein [Cyanobacteria bacterium Co-bin13]
KLFAAFQKIIYQRSELSYVVTQLELLSLAQHFAKVLMRYDFWHNTGWEILPYYAAAIKRFLEEDDPGIVHVQAALLDDFLDVGESEEQIEGIIKRLSITQLWEGLSVLPKNYEETCREWFLPTPHGFSTSYRKTQ